MDSNKRRPAQSTEPTTDPSAWRAELPPESRKKIVARIIETLKKTLPISGSEGLAELQKIAERFEDKIFNIATGQTDYLRKISLKMLTMENRYQNSTANNMPSNKVGPSNIPPDQGLASQPQVHNPGQKHPNPMPSQPQPMPSQPQPMPNQSQTRQQVLPQTIQNSLGSNTIGQNSNVQNRFPSSQRQMLGRQQVVRQQQQHQSQNQQQIHYQQLLKNKLQMQQKQQQSLMQPNQLQSSQQSVMQTSSVMQPSMKQTSLSSIPQNQQSNNVEQSTQSMLQQHSHAIRNQQQTVQTQQSMLPPQQQQLMGSHSNVTNVQNQAQMLGQKNNVSEIQQPQRLLSQQNNLMNPLQRQKMLINKQRNLADIQQRQLGNNVSGLQKQQLFGTESSNQCMQTSYHSAHMQQPKVSMQQQSQQNASNTMSSFSQQSQSQASQQHSMSQTRTQPAQMQQQLGLQKQPNPLQQDMQHKRQQQSALDQQNQLYQSQRALPETSTASADSTAQTAQPSGVEWQEEVYQKIQTLKENCLPELREFYQIILMRIRQHELNPQQKKPNLHLDKMRRYKGILEGLMAFLNISKNKVLPIYKEKVEKYEEQIMAFLNSNRPKRVQPEQLPPTQMPSTAQSQSQVPPVQSCENQMNSQLQPTNLQSSVDTLKQNSIPNLQPDSYLDSGQGSSTYSLQQVPVSSLQQKSVSSPQQTNSSLLPLQGGVNVIQPRSNLDSGQGSSTNSLQQVPVSSLQQKSVSSPQQTNSSSLQLQGGGVNVIQPDSNLDSGQGSSMNSLQQVPVSSLQQKSVSASQQTNTSSLPSQGGVNVIQQNPNTLPPDSSMLQRQQKHKQQQQMLQNKQLLKQYQQRNLLQRQQILQQQQQQQQQQLQQQAKQQLSAQPRTHQLPQLHQMNDSNDTNIRQGVSIKPSGFHQHDTSGQDSAYSQQKLKQGGPFHVSSSQVLQSVSPQIPEHSSPRVDQQTHLSSLTKLATPLHSSTNSPFVGPTPSPPMPGGSEKPIPGVSSLSNVPNVGEYTGDAEEPTQSPTIGSPGVSASPFLAEFSGPDSGHDNSLAATSENSTSENPMDRLIRAVKSMSTDALTSAVNDIYSVVSLNDSIAGSGPGNGSRTTVGEDLVSITNCRVQARNSIIKNGTDATKRIRRFIRTRPSNAVSSAGSLDDSIMQSSADSMYDSFMQSSASESTETYNAKRPKVEQQVNHTLLKEIREINCRLIDTVVGISDEDVDPAADALVDPEGAEGTIVKCSYIPVALSPALKSRYASLQSPIQPLRLLVPPDYPNCSPILLNKFPEEPNEETEDLYEKTKSSFSISLRSLSQPTSVKDIAKTWDNCARGALTAYAQKSGGGTFSSNQGTWMNC